MENPEMNWFEMTSEEIEPHLTAKERRFCWEYAVDNNGTQAAIRAGYKPKGAHVTASRLLKKAKVAAYIRTRQREECEALGVTTDSIILRAHELLSRCMLGTPHMVWSHEQSEWVPDGTWSFDSSGANKALRTLGDAIGAFEHKVALSGGMTLEQMLKEAEAGDDRA